MIPCDNCGKPTKWTKRYVRHQRVVACGPGYFTPCRRAVMKRLLAAGVLVKCGGLKDCKFARLPGDTTPCFRCTHERQRRADEMRDRRLSAERVADARRRVERESREHLPPEYVLPFFIDTIDRMKEAIGRYQEVPDYEARVAAIGELFGLASRIIRQTSALEEHAGNEGRTVDDRTRFREYEIARRRVSFEMAESGLAVYTTRHF